MLEHPQEGALQGPGVVPAVPEQRTGELDQVLITAPSDRLRARSCSPSSTMLARGPEIGINVSSQRYTEDTFAKRWSPVSSPPQLFLSYTQADERLQYLREHGPSPRAFTFKNAFSADEAQ